ncbi:hypothetical protein H6P81_011567 [Aristolochia fimbriata]|uniref:Uncharacterized protein n=1 Tax=Aristolochia fimbriata TaxID=158543 RepID=A0AAV7EVF6_ARIFI|nr:hypothetical protein H6P81_011567 [Aristolochia fimbriata]
MGGIFFTCGHAPVPSLSSQLSGRQMVKAATKPCPAGPHWPLPSPTTGCIRFASPDTGTSPIQLPVRRTSPSDSALQSLPFPRVHDEEKTKKAPSASRAAFVWVLKAVPPEGKSGWDPAGRQDGMSCMVGQSRPDYNQLPSARVGREGGICLTVAMVTRERGNEGTKERGN